MKDQPTAIFNVEQAEALEGRLALRVAARLTEAAELLPHDITERLRFNRERAVSRALAPQRQPEVASALVAAGSAAAIGGPPAFWLRLASLIPLVVVIVGLVVIQQHHDRLQIAVAAEVDAALLADELPPAAYRDPGFNAFLQTQNAP